MGEAREQDVEHGVIDGAVEALLPISAEPVLASGLDKTGRLIPIRVDPKGCVIPSTAEQEIEAACQSARAKMADEIVQAFLKCRTMLINGSFPLRPGCTCDKCQAIRKLDKYASAYPDDPDGIEEDDA
jgi:hypothetical protein